MIKLGTNLQCCSMRKSLEGIIPSPYIVGGQRIVRVIRE
jgi:hypothetical protein